MNKYLLILLVVFGLTSCNKKDEQYYQKHPAELQKAIKACPNKQPERLSCKQIEAIGNQMMTLAYQLQYSPQGFGNKILNLQQKIATSKMDLQKESGNSDLKLSIQQDEHDLAVYLAVVKWLESPES